MAFANSARGLRISGSNFSYLTEGAYALIFEDLERGRIRKVFRARGDVPNLHLDQVFNSEKAAFEIATSTPALAALVPKYFGQVSTETIIDNTGTDVSREFRTDLGIEMEFLDCQFVKIGTVTADQSVRIRKLFGQHGIAHTNDASVGLIEGRIAKVIDFATEEYELWM